MQSSRTMKLFPCSLSSRSCVFLWLVQFAEHPMDAPHLFIIRREKCDSPVEDRYFDGIVGQDESQMIVLNGLAGVPITVNASEVEQVFFIDGGADVCRNLDTAPDFQRQILGLHAFFEHAFLVFNLF